MNGFLIKKVHIFNENGGNVERQERNEVYTNGGLLRKYLWFSNDNSDLYIYDLIRKNMIAKWMFNYPYNIRLVKEIASSYNLPKLLLICLDCDVEGSLLSVFNLTKSMVIKTIKLEEKIRTVEVISTYRNECPLSDNLKCLNGILCIGLEGGEVLLLDLQRDSLNNSNVYMKQNVISDVHYSEVVKVSMKSIDNLYGSCKESAATGNNVALHLNSNDDTTLPHFALKTPTGTDKLHVNKMEVTVSALYYNSQLRTLLVGYNFGAFQMWSLDNLKLCYTSSVHKEHIPVTNFTMQEPADDPREFCYIWVVYSDPESKYVPEAHMYTLVYTKKERKSTDYFLYQELISCTIGFKMNLKELIDDGNIMRIRGARSTNVTTLKRKSKHTNIDLTLCCFTWSYRTDDKFNTVLSIFDLNQWYKAEMPDCYAKCEKFISTTSLSGVTENDLFDICIDENSCQQYLGVQHLEEHYYPSALSFDITVLSDNTVIMAQRQSIQETILNEIKRSDMMCFLTPKEIQEKCIKVGLIPLFVNNATDIGNNANLQKEFILSIALEHFFTGWLCKCASSWFNGSFTSVGCTIELLLNWAWNRANRLKSNADKICSTLFDYSGVGLDENNTRYYSSLVAQFIHLTTLYAFILKDTKNYLADIDIVKEQYYEIMSLTEYYKVIRWMIYSGLLPEGSGYEASTRLLVNYYAERRSANRNFNCENLSGLLFIDNFLEKNCKNQLLKTQWKKDGGTGLYPPNSLQALLRIYLTADLDIQHKHNLLLYFLMDLEEALKLERCESDLQIISTFPTRFKLNEINRKIIRAFWELDHGNCENALYLLLDSRITSNDLSLWQHDLVLESLDYYGLHRFALLYIHTKNIVMDDWRKTLMMIRLYVINHKFPDALKFIRKNPNGFNDVAMYTTLFKECQTIGSIKALLQLNLNYKEEIIFFDYLTKIKHPNLRDFKAVYYLQRSRYVDILNINKDTSDINKKEKNEKHGLLGLTALTLEERIRKMVGSMMPNVKLRVPNRKEESEDPDIRVKITMVNVFPINSVPVDPKLRSPDPHLFTPNPKKRKLNESDDEMASNYFTSILKQVTPLVKRKLTPPITSDGCFNTPHSILKLRKRFNETQNENEECLVDTEENNILKDVAEKKEENVTEVSHNKHGVRFQISPNRTVETSQNVPSFSQTLENSGVSVSLEDYYSPDTSPKVSIKTKGTPYVKKINYNESSESSSILSCTSRQVSPAARQSYKDLSVEYVSSNDKVEPKTIDTPILPKARVLFQNEPDDELKDDSVQSSKLAMTINSTIDTSHMFEDMDVDNESSDIANVAFVEDDLTSDEHNSNESITSDTDNNSKFNTSSSSFKPSRRRSIRLSSSKSLASSSTRTSSIKKRTSLRKSISNKMLVKKAMLTIDTLSFTEDSILDPMNVANVLPESTSDIDDICNTDNSVVSLNVVEEETQTLVTEEIIMKTQEKSSFNIQDQSNSNVQETSSLKIHDQSNSNVQDASSLKIQDQSNSNVQEKSSFNIQDQSNSNVQETSSLMIQDQSNSNVQEASSSKIQDQSKSNIKEDNYLNIEEKSKELIQDGNSSRTEEINIVPDIIENENKLTTDNENREVNDPTVIKEDTSSVTDERIDEDKFPETNLNLDTKKRKTKKSVISLESFLSSPAFTKTCSTRSKSSSKLSSNNEESKLDRKEDDFAFLGPFSCHDTSSTLSTSSLRRNTRCSSVEPTKTTSVVTTSRGTRRARSESVDVVPQVRYNLRHRKDSTSSVVSNDTEIASVSSSKSSTKRAVSVNIPLAEKESVLARLRHLRKENLKNEDDTARQTTEAATVNIINTSRLTRSQKKLLEGRLPDTKLNKSLSTSDLSQDTTSTEKSMRRARRTLPLSIIAEEDGHVKKTRSKRQK